MTKPKDRSEMSGREGHNDKGDRSGENRGRNMCETRESREGHAGSEA